MKKLRVQHDCDHIDWQDVSDILKSVGMAYFKGETHQKAFKNSRTVVFVFDDEKLVGFGRAISDGAYQAAIYDVAVRPEYQGRKVGSMIVQQIVESIPHCNFLLYAAPGKEEFYQKLNFRRMKTGMALFLNSDQMQSKGFTE
jgi:ribosomal protein S18 acetylase RimI-like enzyme